MRQTPYESQVTLINMIMKISSSSATLGSNWNSFYFVKNVEFSCNNKRNLKINFRNNKMGLLAFK
jgi:hypothetical protein